MSARSVRGLQVYQATGDGTHTVPLQPNDSRFRLSRTVVDRGLLILESEGGQVGLRDLAREIIIGLRRSRGPCLYPREDRDFRYLDHYVTQFISLMRSNPPEIYLTTLPGEAATVRYDWAGPQSTMEDFLPINAGHLQLSGIVLDHMASTRDNDQLNMYMFQMAISVAHEMGHFLTGYITGAQRPQTPPNVRVPGAIGEAGYYWEVRALGGIVEFFSDPSDPNNTNQAGIPYLFQDGRRSAPGVRVSSAYIQRFVAGSNGFEIPVPSSARSAVQTRSQLERISHEMVTLRRLAAEATQATARSGRSGTAGTQRYRGEQHYYTQYYPTR